MRCHRYHENAQCWIIYILSVFATDSWYNNTGYNIYFYFSCITSFPQPGLYLSWRNRVLKQLPHWEPWLVMVVVVDLFASSCRSEVRSTSISPLLPPAVLLSPWHLGWCSAMSLKLWQWNSQFSHSKCPAIFAFNVRYGSEAWGYIPQLTPLSLAI